MLIDTLTPAVGQSFFQPLHEALAACDHTRACPTLADPDWLVWCVRRVLSESKTGRGFLQDHGLHWPGCPEVSTFFESLKSRRRLRLLEELNRALGQPLAQHLPDQRLADPRLEAFDLYAGDGHWHAAAVHDPVQEGTKFATGHLFGLDLRTQGAFHLTVADQLTRRKEHDMRGLKRLEVQTLRQGAPKGRKVLWVWDKAAIDFRQWYAWKQSAGIYFISRVKENMRLEVTGELKWDRADPVNAGVVADEYVATSQGVMMRRVTYRDPVTGTGFEFLTSEMTLPPGWIAQLYRLRWEIEKVFDEFKNKLSEKKAWASSPTAKTLQANFLCLTHNLLRLFEGRILEPAAILNHAENRRRTQRLERTRARLAAAGEKLPPLVQSLQRCTQHTVKLIRWIRAHLTVSTSCTQALASLATLYAKS